MPSLATIPPHEEQPPLLEEARQIVEQLFDEVEAEARRGREDVERRREEVSAMAGE